MDQPIANYWKLRLKDLKAALESNKFDVFIADNKDDARQIVLEEIIPQLNPRTLSWGGSMSVIASGLYHHLKKNSEAITDIDPPQDRVLGFN